MAKARRGEAAPKKPRITKRGKVRIAEQAKRTREADRRDAAEEAARAKVLRGRTRDAQAARLLVALETAQDVARERGYSSALQTAGPPGGLANEGAWIAPWAIVGRFVWKSPVGYTELYEILERWAMGRVSNKVNPERLARIRVEYGESHVGGRSERLEYTLGETFPWTYMLARAMQQCDPSDTESVFPGGAVGSLAARYADTQIKSVFVWLSTGVGINAMKQKKKMPKVR